VLVEDPPVVTYKVNRTGVTVDDVIDATTVTAPATEPA
jgi:hypothetical protein